MMLSIDFGNRKEIAVPLKSEFEDSDFRIFLRDEPIHVTLSIVKNGDHVVIGEGVIDEA